MDLFQVRFNGMVRMCDVIFKDTKILQQQGIEVRITEREKKNRLPLSNKKLKGLKKPRYNKIQELFQSSFTCCFYVSYSSTSVVT